MKAKILFSSLVLFLFVNAAFAQIKLQNASFEGEPQDATTPVAWHPCEAFTTPDILPGQKDGKDIWGVYNEASEGDTYVGIITRPNGTFESIGQRTSEPLLPGECYTFTIDVSHSMTYTGYGKPIRLRVWGGSTQCDKTLMIGKTGFIEEEEWETVEFTITPAEGAPINYIILEAYYTDKDDNSRMGNILLDNISDIVKCKRAFLSDK